MFYRFQEHSPILEPSVFVAPTAVVIGKVFMRSGVSIWFNTIVRGDINSITIGKDSNIQDNCVVHVTNEHKVEIEERVTIGHGVIVHGCHIQSDCLIGMGSVVLDGAVIGAGSIVAAGAVVAPNTIVAECSLVMGVPGRVVRQINDDERKRMLSNWQNYVGYARSYRDSTIFEQVEPLFES